MPLFFEAKQMNAAILTPVTEDCSGVLTVVTGSAFDLKTLGTFGEASFRGDRGLFEYSAADALVANYQPGKIDFTLSISGIPRARRISEILDVYASHDLLRCALRAGCPPDGATNPGKYFVVIGRIADIDAAWREARNNDTITLRPVGILPQWLTTPTI